MSEYVIDIKREMVYEELRDSINQLYSKYATNKRLNLEETDNPMEQVRILEERRYVTKIQEQIEQIYQANKLEKFNLADYRHAINAVKYRIRCILEE